MFITLTEGLLYYLSILYSYIFQGKKWAYDSCPDIDECKLGLDDCDPNATCVNIPGSFECHCNKGNKFALKV